MDSIYEINKLLLPYWVPLLYSRSPFSWFLFPSRILFYLYFVVLFLYPYLTWLSQNFPLRKVNWQMYKYLFLHLRMLCCVIWFYLAFSMCLTRSSVYKMKMHWKFLEYFLFWASTHGILCLSFSKMIMVLYYMLLHWRRSVESGLE